MAKKSKRTNKLNVSKKNIKKRKKRKTYKAKNMRGGVGKHRRRRGDTQRQREKEQLQLAIAMSESLQEDKIRKQVEADEKYAHFLEGTQTETLPRPEPEPEPVTLRSHQAKALPHLSLSDKNMLEESYIYYSKGGTIGYLIAGNAGKVGGGLRRGDHNNPKWEIRCKNKKQIAPQEEGSFINFYCATTNKKGDHGAHFLNQMETADEKWGMIDLSDTGVGVKTKQSVDYTKGINFKYKYERCVYVGELCGYSQKGISKTLKGWDENKLFTCEVFITAGPQARNPDTEFRWGRLYPTQSMKRTYDDKANKDVDYLINCITAAYVGSLREMDSKGVTVAIVPGLSTGVYAPPSKQNLIITNIPQIIRGAIKEASPFENVKKVIYCHPGNPGATKTPRATKTSRATKASRATKTSRAKGATRATREADVPRQIMAKLNKFKGKYSETHGDALNEIKEDGQKQTCWSWWIWPISNRDAGGKSKIRKEWSLSEEECKHFILEPGLGDKWLEIMEELLKKLESDITLLYLTGNNPRDEEVVKQSCSFFRHCAFGLDDSIDIVKRVFDVSNNILSKV